MSQTKVTQQQNFNTTEGGLFLGCVARNNAKMSVMLRNIFPMGFKRAHYIGLQQTGKLKGSIINSAPAVFEIMCGERPAAYTGSDNGMAGFWYAENGDVIIHAPRGKIVLSAQNVDLIATGDGKETGYVNFRGSQIVGKSDKIKMDAGDSCGISGKNSMNIASVGNIKTEGGDVQTIEGADALRIPGTGNLSIFQWGESMAKLAKNIVGG